MVQRNISLKVDWLIGVVLLVSILTIFNEQPTTATVIGSARSSTSSTPIRSDPSHENHTNNKGLPLHKLKSTASNDLDYSGTKRKEDEIAVVGEPTMTDTSTLSPPLQFAELCPQEWQNGTYAWSAESTNRCCGPKRSFSKVGVHDPLFLLNNTTNQTHEFQYFMEAPLGNRLVHYYNERAVAYLRNQTFVAKEPFLTEGLVACFPMVVSPSVVGTSLELRAIQSRLKSPIESIENPNIHGTAAFRLVPRMISSETIAIAQAWSSLPAHELDLPGSNTVVVHLRCDAYILLRHTEYGVLPHRFVLDRLPKGTEEVAIVRKPEGGENACTWSFRDLVEKVEDKGLRVTIRSSPELVSDWLYMARAKTLFCSPSTFCLTAAWGNPNKVFFPTCGTKSAVVEQDSHINQVLKETGNEYPNLVWVNSDYLPGKIARQKKKNDVISYARSQFCDTKLHGCFRSPQA